MRAVVYLSLSFILAFIAGCCSADTECQTEYNDAFADSSWFESAGMNDKGEKICVVKYYVNGDTIFTTQKYSALTLSYSLDADNSFLYRQIFVFDDYQIRDSEGWYHIVVNRDNIWREPATHLSSVVLHRFSNNSDGFRESKAYLYEATFDDSCYNQLTPQLTKLYPVIK